MNDAQRLTVSRTIEAPIERVFAMLADPERHPDFDGSRTVRRALTHSAITDVGEVFSMRMRAKDLGDYQTDNLVTTYERDRAIGWAPGVPGHRPFGHTFTFLLEPLGDDRTQVTEIYDWSGVTNEKFRAVVPRVSREELAASLDLLADILQ